MNRIDRGDAFAQARALRQRIQAQQTHMHLIRASNHLARSYIWYHISIYIHAKLTPRSAPFVVLVVMTIRVFYCWLYMMVPLCG